MRDYESPSTKALHSLRAFLVCSCSCRTSPVIGLIERCFWDWLAERGDSGISSGIWLCLSRGEREGGGRGVRSALQVPQRKVRVHFSV